MAGFTGIAAVGKSIERVLARAFLEREPVPGKKTKAVLIRTEAVSYTHLSVTVRDVVPLTVGRRFMTWDGVEYPGPDTGEPTRGKGEGEGGRRGK